MVWQLDDGGAVDRVRSISGVFQSPDGARELHEAVSCASA